MSLVVPGTLPTGPVLSLKNLPFNYSGADIILRSCDSYEFRVPKMYIFRSSPVLGEQVLAADIPQPDIVDTAAATIPFVQLSDCSAILFSLLTHISPVQPILPSTVEQIMELLSAAQKYEMDATLIHIRNHIAQQQPPFIQEENSLYMYSLAQKHGLRQEVLQAARCTLSFSNFTIDSLDEKLQLMPGAFLHELWKYHQRVRAYLTSGLKDFIASRARAIFEGHFCRSVTSASRPVPSWLGRYISSIGRRPHLFDLSRFYIALAGHIQSLSNHGGCHACATISNKIIEEFWAALSAVYRDSIIKVRVNDDITLD